MWMKPVATPLGNLTLVSDGRNLCGVYFDRHAHVSGRECWQTGAEFPLFVEAERQFAEYFAGERRDFDLPCAANGTAFQREVWRALARIPYGKTVSYAQLATQIGRPKAVRAVAAANARNPLSILTPCHRVIGSDGSLTGYAGGIHNKQKLLLLERQSGIR